jgi:hypothetical protein
MKAAAVGLVMSAIVLAAAAAQPAPVESASTGRRPLQQTIRFDDIAPAGMVLQQCWNAIGIDDQERVYIGFTARRADGREDFAVFRYDPATGHRRLLGTFMEASAAAGNLQPGEEIPKGHTHFVTLDGRLYMGSQGFHDLKRGLANLPTYRGSHLYAYDTAADVFEEVSRSLPGGVVTRHSGLIALTAVPGRRLLAGLEHPSSNIVLFDPGANRVQAIVPGIPWREGNPLSREIVATRQGRIYTYRGSEEPRHRGRRHAIWVHDLGTAENRPTMDTATGGFWNGQSGTRDGATIFLSTVNGELYRLDTASGQVSSLGHFLPKADVDAGQRIDQLYGITLSADETRIYAVPRRHGSRESVLYAYEIATGIVTRVGTLESALYAGSHVRDSRGNLYLGRFGSDRASQGNAGLAIVSPPAQPPS